MKKWIIILLLASAGWARTTSTNQQNINPGTIPFAVDVNRLHTGDPNYQTFGLAILRENERTELILEGKQDEGYPFVISALDIPSGSEFNSLTNTWKWTPPTGKMGTYYLQFVITDVPAFPDTPESTIGIIPIRVERRVHTAPYFLSLNWP